MSVSLSPLTATAACHAAFQLRPRQVVRLGKSLPDRLGRPAAGPFSVVGQRMKNPPSHFVGSSSSTALSSSTKPAHFPRAAVSVVVRWCDSSTTPNTESPSPRWLLVQRGKEPNKGMWSLPGGKIETGEGTLEAAKRELWEETGVASHAFDLRWHEMGPFACSDSIHRSDGSTGGFHYVISQCFAELVSLSIPNVDASDDAMDARWWNINEVEKAESSGEVTRGVSIVLERSELLYTNGFLECN